MFALSSGVIDPSAVADAVRHDGAGAVIVFEGVTRDHHDGKAVTRLEYEAYPGMAEAKMAAVGESVVARWPGVRVAMVHRTGVVELGEASVVIAVSAAHRSEAYEASRAAIDALKATVPIWKKEHYADGSAWQANQEQSSVDQS